MTKILLFAVLTATVLLHSQERRTRIVLTGDSTVNDEGGWGPGFRTALGSGFEIINLAKNGRSSKSFRDEGWWQKALDARPAFILMQFGHNDGPGKGPARETDPATTYRVNMMRYIRETREAGATPILVTSIVRRNLTPDGKVKADSLVPFVEEIRQIAAETHTPLIDLYSLTRAQCEQLGPAECHALGAIGKDGKVDNTHLGASGRQSIGAVAAAEFTKILAAPRH